MSPRHRILLVESDARIGGSGRSFMHLISGLDREHFDLVVACPPNGPIRDWVVEQGFECQWPPSYAGRGIWVGSQLSWGVWFRLLLRRRHVDLVHVNDVAGFRVVGWSARLAGVPAVCHVRMAPTPEELAWSFGLSRPAAIVFNSRAMAEYTQSLLPESFAGIPAVIVPNAVDTRRFRPTEDARDAKVQLGWSPDALAVTVVSNLSPLKGQDLFVEAAAEVCRRFDGRTEFHLVGRDLTADGRIVRALGERIQHLGLTGRVRIHGALENVALVFQASDIVVWPSRAISVSPADEDQLVRSVGFPRCAIEAAACGRALILADTPGAEEAAIPNETALMVPPANPEALAAAMLTLLTDPARREAMGRAARALAESKFNLQQHSRLIERLYQSVLETHPRRTSRASDGASLMTAGRK